MFLVVITASLALVIINFKSIINNKLNIFINFIKNYLPRHFVYPIFNYNHINLRFLYFIS